VTAVIGRTRGIRISKRGLEVLWPDDADFKRPLARSLSSLIERSNPYLAGELAHNSAGLLVADRLCEEHPSEQVRLIGLALAAEEIDLPMNAKSLNLWWLVDLAAIAIRLVWRLLARPVHITTVPKSVLFVTNDRHHEMVAPLIEDEVSMVLNPRLESQTRLSRSNPGASLMEAWRRTGERGLAGRIRMTRLVYEASDLRSLLEGLSVLGLERVLLADITGHRVRLIVDEATRLGLGPTIFQHGRILNPCRYVPAPGSAYVFRSDRDLEFLASTLGRSPHPEEWVVAPAPLRTPKRQGSGVLICPSRIGSRQRLLRLRSVADEVRDRGDVGVRFHPDERFARLKAAYLKAELVDSRSPIREIDHRWGKAVVPFLSSVQDDLLDAGFVLLEPS